MTGCLLPVIKGGRTSGSASEGWFPTSGTTVSKMPDTGVMKVGVFT